MIQQVVFNESLMQKLRGTEVVMNALDTTTRKKVETQTIQIDGENRRMNFYKYLKEIFSDPEFLRHLRYLSHLKSNIELAVEYYGNDFLSSPDYHYHEDLEKQFDEIESNLHIFLGSILKEVNKGAQIEL